MGKTIDVIARSNATDYFRKNVRLQIDKKKKISVITFPDIFEEKAAVLIHGKNYTTKNVKMKKLVINEDLRGITELDILNLCKNKRNEGVLLWIGVNFLKPCQSGELLSEL